MNALATIRVSKDRPLRMDRPFWLMVPAKRAGAHSRLPRAFVSRSLMSSELANQEAARGYVRFVDRFSVAAVLRELLQRGFSAIGYDRSEVSLLELLNAAKRAASLDPGDRAVAGAA